MRRTVVLLMIAGVSLCTLFYARVDDGILARAILLGCPAGVALLAAMQRPHEAPVGRVLLTAIAGIGVGQLLAVLLGPRVANVATFDSLSYFFLAFGIPVIVVLCLIALVSTPFAEDDEEAVEG